MTNHSDRLPDLRFLVEPTDEGNGQRLDAAELVDVAVGRGVRSLDLESFASKPRLLAARRGRGLNSHTLQFEPLSVDKRPVLLMLTPPGVEVRVNGQPSPRVAVLTVGDQVQIEDTTLHLTRYRKFEVGPPSPELLGRPCGICRVQFDEHTRVYVHDCGEPMHLEPESKPVEKRLECALLPVCLNCEQPISMQSGFTYLPEL
jgi:hypothetical protein